MSIIATSLVGFEGCYAIYATEVSDIFEKMLRSYDAQRII
jgi:hypothetical protein